MKRLNFIVKKPSKEKKVFLGEIAGMIILYMLLPNSSGFSKPLYMRYMINMPPKWKNIPS